MTRGKSEFDIYKYRNCFDDYADVQSREIIRNSVENPFFTIIIPTYKRSGTIGFALHSALEQVEFENYEIVIVNNQLEGETDETLRIINEYPNNRRISYYTNDRNIGMCGNWNRCVELAHGEYIVMLHDDDVLSPYCLTSLYKAINENSFPVMVGCTSQTFTSSNPPIFIKPEKLKYRIIDKVGFFYGRYLGIAGMTFRKDTAINIGGFADEYYPNEDTVFIYQMVNNGMVINIDNILVGYRKEFNTTTSGDTLDKIVLLTEKIRRNIAEYEPFANRFMRKYDKEFLYDYIQGANRYWGVQLDYKRLFDESGIVGDVSNRRMLAYKLERRIERILNKRVKEK